MTRQRQAPLKLEFDVVAAGLQFPEGSCVLGEDSLRVVELARRTLTHVDLRAARRWARAPATRRRSSRSGSSAVASRPARPSPTR